MPDATSRGGSDIRVAGGGRPLDGPDIEGDITIMIRYLTAWKKTALLAAVLLLGVTVTASFGQDKLKEMPRYDRYERMLQAHRDDGVFVRGTVDAEWSEDGMSFEYERQGTVYRYDLRTGGTTAVGEVSREPRGGRRGGPARGRQWTEAESPDEQYLAFYRDRNLWVSRADGSDEYAVTTDGSKEQRIKYGTASWVYGEELRQTTAMWWSPDSEMLGYYRFDESGVPDYFLQLGQTELYSESDIEAYPKSGYTNPVADLFVYDLQTRKSVRIGVRSGEPFTDDVVGHYVYNIRWSPDSSEILFNRTNRRQNVMEFCAADPRTGETRVIIREEWLPSWTTNSPSMRYLEDEYRFIWTSERNGFSNLYLYDLSGKLNAALTEHPFEVAGIEYVDEEEGRVFYTARDGENHMKMQLHVVGLDGSGHRRLTDPAMNHSVDFSPSGDYFLITSQTHDTPPVTRLMDADGEVVDTIVESDMSEFERLGLKESELFTYMAADGRTTLHGILHFPSDFDPAKEYPLLVSVYAGPATNGASERFQVPPYITELGFLMARLDSRSAGGRGKEFLDAIYMRLGITEIDDQAAGVRALAARPYVDGENVGIYGTSYGGYASAMCLFRYPDLFQAASASSAVTSWYHYDTIYTERYMYTPQVNKEGYEAGSAMSYVEDLQGDLMIYYGTADNNVHPNNSMQLIQALQQAGKSFEVQVGPDRGHSGIMTERMLEFFIESLILPAP
ncbi:MAG: DPP IV N-terminal domain-containing protein [bacterium]